MASPKQWQAIIVAKGGPCRLCSDPGSNGSVHGRIHFHHIVARGAPYFGDDTEDNIAPLCGECHGRVTRREPHTLAALAASLTDAEYAYVVAKLGESGPARLFGVGR